MLRAPRLLGSTQCTLVRLLALNAQFTESIINVYAVVFGCTGNFDNGDSVCTLIGIEEQDAAASASHISGLSPTAQPYASVLRVSYGGRGWWRQWGMDM